MAAEAVNSFFSGLVKDSSKLTQPQGTYSNALNLRLETQDGGSRGAIVNAGSNSSLITIPSTSDVVEVSYGTTTPTWPLTIFTFTINGVPIVITATTTTLFQTLSDTINASAPLAALGIVSAYTTTHVLIYSGYNAQNVLITSVISVSVNVNPSNTISISTVITGQTGLQIIGWTTIRDEIILLTTNNTSKNPGGHSFDATLPTDPSSLGQIWRLTYDQERLTPILVLLYNNFIDFTTYHPVAPTAILGHYENASTKKIYWTDFFNPFRFFDTVDDNGFALNPLLLSRRPETSIAKPVLQAIGDSGGVLETGVYQAVYRLKFNGGTTTHFFEPSNTVVIVPVASTVPFRDFIGATAGTATSKTISWKIDPIDTKYDRIEVAIIKRLTNGSISAIELFKDEPVPASGVYTFNYTGNELVTPLSLGDILAIEDEFTHCKTIASKDNALLVANTRSEKFDLDFDARAYRFNSDPTTATRFADIQDTQGNSTIIPAAAVLAGTYNWAGIPETHDAINPDQSSQTQASYRFQADGATLGGEGQYVKYTFDVSWLTGDDNITGNGFGNMGLDIAAGLVGQNGRFTNNNSLPVVINGVTYPNNGFYESHKSPYRASAMRGYQHDEVYRFGIKFYDTSGRPSFVKWIGDIRMPLIYEAVYPYPISFTQHLISDRNGFNGAQRVGILRPQFTVNLPQAVKDKIAGWEIVRADRTVNNKTVLAAGTIHPVEFDSTGPAFYAQTPNDYFIGGHDQEIATFRSPEFTFLTYPGYLAGDTIKFISIQQNSFSVPSGNPAAPDEFEFVKNYDSAIVAANTAFIEKTLGPESPFFLPRGASNVLGTTAILNYVNAIPTNDQGSNGDDTLVLDWRNDTPIPFLTGIYDKYYALYKRPLNTGILSSQYGGNSYSQRSLTEYITCDQYQETPILNTTLLFTVEAFGGDIFTTVWDNQKMIKGWAQSFSTTFQRALIYYQPVQSIINTEWRHGAFVNKDGFPDNGTGIDVGEDYSYNTAYSLVNNVKPGFSKPVNFLSVDEFDSRIYISNVKINGESDDSWLIFDPNERQDAESIFGPINSMFVWKDQVLFLQDKAFGTAPVNERALIQSNSSSTLQLGTGERLIRPDYISTQAGSKHQWGVTITDKGVYFFDIYTKKLYQFSGPVQSLAEIKGLGAYFKTNLLGNVHTTDNPVYKDPTLANARAGMAFGYNRRYNEVFFTFMDVEAGAATPVESAFTVSFNELFGVFQSFHSFQPGIYISDRFNMITINPNAGGAIYVHDHPTITTYGTYYGTVNDSTIEVVVNPNPTFTKAFDNSVWHTEVINSSGVNVDETFDTARWHTDYQNTDFVTLDPVTVRNVKRKERNWNTVVPRDVVDGTVTNPNIFAAANLAPSQLFKKRLRDKTCTIDLVFHNTTARRLIFHYLKTLFRLSYR